MPTATITSGNQTIHALDGLRGLAVLLVVLSHFSLAGVNLFPALNFSGAGKSGVYLFFVLSAFLLTFQGLQQTREGLHATSYWLGYGIRRVLRIFPLYVLVILMAWGLTRWTEGYGPRIETAEEALRHLLLLEGKHIFWAIPVEFKYYLLLPLVTLGLYWSGQVKPWLPVLLTLLAVPVLLFFWPQADTPVNTISLGPYLLIFILGSMTAWLVRLPAPPEPVREALGWISVILALLTVPAAWRALIDPDITNQYFHHQFLLYAVCWTLSVYAAVTGPSWFRRFFELGAWRFLGRISFSVYLLHFPIIQFLAKFLPWSPSIKFVAGMLITLGISYFSYRVIERPFIVWGHARTRSI